MSPPLSRLTALLRAHRDQIIERWTSRLRREPKIPQAQVLTDEDLRNYTPKLLDDLIESLAQGAERGASGLDIGSSEAAKIHVEHRRAQRYTLAEELRELGMLRAVILELCAQEGVILGGEEGQLVHSAIDEVMVTTAIAMEQASSADLRQDVMIRELFIAVLGHDLRSPLSAIRFATASLLKRADVPAPALKIIQRIHTSNERAVRMVEEMLDVTRIRVHGSLLVEPKEADLIAICQQAVEEIELTHPDSTIVFEARGDARGAWDPVRIAQVVSNLVSNAVDYSPPGEPVRVKLSAQKKVVTLEVHNSGPPIPPELLPVIFDPFRQGTQEPGKTKGLGLGLFIARSIVEAHRGSLEVTSTAEQGTTFTARLPR